MTRRLKYTTPIGKAMWTNVMAGKGMKGYKDDVENIYQAQVYMPVAEGHEFKEFLDAFASAKFPGRHIKYPGYFYCDEEGTVGKGDTHILFKAKSKMTFPNGAKKEIPVYNAKRDVLDSTDLYIGNGSIIRFSCILSSWESHGNCGVALYLDQLQALDIVGNACPFDVEDDYAAYDKEGKGEGKVFELVPPPASEEEEEDKAEAVLRELEQRAKNKGERR